MRYSQDDVHAVLMAAATIYRASKNVAVAVEEATEILDATRKHLEHQNLQAEVDGAYEKARFHRLYRKDIKSLDGSLFPDSGTNSFIRPESIQNLQASVDAAIAKAKRAEAEARFYRIVNREGQVTDS